MVQIDPDEGELIEQAREIHRHCQRVRNFLLSGESSTDAWSGMAKDPTLAQIRALFVLHTQGDSTLKQMAAGLGCSTAAASELADRLVEMGLLTREQDSEDRRRVVISLTGEARRRVEAHESAVLAQVSELMRRLGAEGVALWIDLAARVEVVLHRESPE